MKGQQLMSLVMLFQLFLKQESHRGLKIAGITQMSLGNGRNVTCILFSVQELTEEGLPFLILFHMKDDLESLEKFQQEVARQLISEKGWYQLVTAGTIFFFQMNSI